MQRRRKFPVGLFATTFFVITLSLSLCVFGDSVVTEQSARPDLTTVYIETPAGELERPPVQFPHDLHTEAMKERNKDCTECHPQLEDGGLSPLFMRLENVAGQDLESLYHDTCTKCHNEDNAAGLKSGPVACGECHRKNPLYSSSRQPFGFDKSLHYRHIKAHNEKCDGCHHLYNEESKELVYIEGKENPCRDCHREQTEDNRISLRLAAHADCVGCHRNITVERPDDPSGPLSCGGCHDRDRQKAIKVVEELPRLKRGQPDFVLLSAPELELDFSKLNTVPFSHVDHEQFTTTCRVCHHESLSPCGDCHTLTGIDKGSGVTLQQAMHGMTSDHSCIGCHQSRKTAAECAGCHDLMEQGRLSERSCNVCHVGPPPENLEDVRPLYTSMDMFRSRPAVAAFDISSVEVPDTVVVASLSKKFSAVKMPHGKIVNKLKLYVADSKIATHFHGGDKALCEGCHHHGSIGRKPAMCENCHGEPFRENDLFKPGLYGAFHRQCLGCHLSMGLQKASGCAVCHEKEDLMMDEFGSAPLGEGAAHE